MSAARPALRLVLASASPARLATLRGAGVEPHVLVSRVDEWAETARAQERFGELAPADLALVLARAKCEDVTARLEEPDDADALGLPEEALLVLGCDSVLEFDGTAFGKPASSDDARRRWRRMSGRTGILHSGHWLVDLRDPTAGGTGATFGATASTTVFFAALDAEEIEAYVETGEPLAVAGAFTLDGLGGPYVDRIEGDPHNVVGVSLPLLRELLAEIDVPWRALRGGAGVPG